MSLKPKGIRQRRNSWQVDVRVNGQLYRKSFPLTTPLATMLEWREEQKAGVAWQAHEAAITAKRVPASLDGWCYVYFARAGAVVKIGRAIDPQQRIRELQTAHAGELVLLAVVAAHVALEGAIHKRFQHLRTRDRGEWFRLDPDLVAFIQLIRNGANPVALLFEDPRVVLAWHLHPPPPTPTPTEDPR